jgi:hypothetical protein
VRRLVQRPSPAETTGREDAAHHGEPIDGRDGRSESKEVGLHDGDGEVQIRCSEELDSDVPRSKETTGLARYG